MNFSSNFVCTKFEGNPCGEFGIQLGHLDETTEVCFEGELHSNILEFYSQLNISVWYLKGDQYKFELDCHLWCSTDLEASPPARHELSDEEMETVEALVGWVNILPQSLLI